MGEVLPEMTRLRTWSCLLFVLAASLAVASGGGAAIEPPWCGTPIPDAAASLPTTGTGNFAHIPWYAIGCTLDDIAARSNGRMTVERHGQSALGRDMYLVTINALDTKTQRKDYSNWQKIRRFAIGDPEHSQEILEDVGDRVKVPLFIQGGIHGGEFEGVDASMQLIEKLATTPYGTDPEVDQILDHAILIFNPIQNPDGRIAGQRANGNGFDLNRDFLTQSQSETLASVSIMQEWLPPDMLDMHGYVTPTLVEATTKPHNPGIDYDLWLKWNQSRIDANEALMNANGFQITRPINDWCADTNIPNPTTGLCPDGTNHFGPSYAEGWDDWGPFYTPMYSQLVGLNGSTVEMCNSTSTVTGSNPPRSPCGPLISEPQKLGRLGSRMAQYLVGWSTLLFDTSNRVDLLNDQLEVYRRGVDGEPRPACCPPPFDVENNWMHEYPQAYAIPIGEGQRSNREARRLVRWLLFNGIEVDHVTKSYDYGSTKIEKGSYVVWMDQAHRGLADTALGPGVDVSSRIAILYAPPAAWSHGYLWGADVISVPDGDTFKPKTEGTDKARQPPGVLDGTRGAQAYAFLLNSPTAIRVANSLLAAGVPAEASTVPFSTPTGGTFPAGSLIFPTSAASQLEDIADDTGENFHGIKGALPAREPIQHLPKIAVLTGAVNQDVWTLRNLGFVADPISTATLNTSPTDPLAGYDVIFNTAGFPANNPGNANSRARLTAFLAAGGGYVGANTAGAQFLVNGGQLPSTPGNTLTVATQSGGGAGYSGIINWNNAAPITSVVTGAYRAADTAIVDPPSWFTAVPSSMTVDASLPLTGFFLSGLWRAIAPTAPGAAFVAHGTNTAGSARLTSYAMNPMYRADPEREWPMLASSIYWVDQ
jgi:zinc carboxypeptidase